MKNFISLTLLISTHSYASCFTRTFCSTGAAPKYVLCGRGQDCSKAQDTGLQFKADCQVSRWLGDAQETKTYKVNAKTISIIPPAWNTEKITEDFQLSDNGLVLTSLSNSLHVFSVKACPQK